MRVLSAAALLLLAGCLDTASPAASEVQPPEGTDPGAVEGAAREAAPLAEPTTATLRFELAFGTDAAADPLMLAMNYVDGTEFDLAQGAVALLVEGRWTCASPDCAFSIGLLDRNGTEVARGEGPSKMRLEHEPAPAPGRWSLDIDPQGAIARAEGEIRVTQSPVPLGSGFTALG